MTPNHPDPDFPDAVTFTLQALPVDGYRPVAVRVRGLLKIAPLPPEVHRYLA